MDAVFYPNIYEKEEIFRQEGWHYQLDQVEDPLKYNGVVYNEMKEHFHPPKKCWNVRFSTCCFRIPRMV